MIPPFLRASGSSGSPARLSQVAQSGVLGAEMLFGVEHQRLSKAVTSRHHPDPRYQRMEQKKRRRERFQTAGLMQHHPQPTLGAKSPAHTPANL